MNSTFYYQRHLRNSNSFIVFIVCLGIATVSLLPLILDDILFEWIHFPVRLPVYLGLTMFFFGVLIFQINRELRGTTYTVTDDMLIKKSLWSTLGVYFSNVRQLRYKRLVLWQGLGTIKSEKMTMRLPLVIENTSGLVSLIEERLVACGNTAAFDRAEIDNFKHDARINDLSTQRTVGVLRHLVLIIAFSILFNWVTAFRIWRLPVLYAVAWAIGGFITPLFSYLVSDYILSVKTERRILERTDCIPDLDASGVYYRVGLVAGAVHLVLGIIYRDLYWWWISFVGI